MSLAQALAMASDHGLDLVEVDPHGNPPVCRLLDYGKWRYQQAKRERDARKHQRGAMVHQVRMRPRIGPHDMALKVRTAERLLGEGDKVKVSVMFRGREMTHPELGEALLARFYDSLKHMAAIEKPADMEGRFLTMILAPTNKKRLSRQQAKPPEEQSVA